jgi:hypothetical protein
MRLRFLTPDNPPQYYQCPICDLYHEITYAGDCRDNDTRFDPAELDQRFGMFGWQECELPAWDQNLRCE